MVTQQHAKLCEAHFEIFAPLGHWCLSICHLIQVSSYEVPGGSRQSIVLSSREKTSIVPELSMTTRYSKIPRRKHALTELIILESRAKHATPLNISQSRRSSFADVTDTTRRVAYGSLSADTWFWEIAALLFSAVCLIAIGAILRVYNGHDVPHFYKGLTLNTIISILATTSKSALLFAASAAIGQLKWDWFQGSTRNLHDIVMFDDASRGPLGAFTMLASPRIAFKSIATIGAIATILLLGFDPFVQQLLTYPNIPVVTPSQDVRVKKALTFNDSLPSMDIISRGIYSTTFDFPLEPSCDTGNCTWPDYNSIAWCTSCEVQDLTNISMVNCAPYPDLSISSTVFRGDNPDSYTGFSLLCDINYKGLAFSQAFNMTFAIPGYWMQSSNEQVGYMTSVYLITPAEQNLILSGGWDIIHRRLWRPGEYGSIKDPLLAFSHFQYDYTLGNLTVEPFIREVQECILTPCVNTNSVSMQAGRVISETSMTHYGSIHNVSSNKLGESISWTEWSVEDTTQNDTSNQTGNATNVSSDYNGGRGNLTNSTTPDELKIPYLDNIWASLTERLIDSTLSTKWYFSVQSYDITGSRPNTVQLMNASGNEMKGFVDMGPEALAFIAANGGTARALWRIAAALTNATLDDSAEFVTRSSHSLQVKVQVRPIWLTLPVFLVLLCTLFVVMTIFISGGNTKTKAWKSSALPLLYHGLEDVSERDGFAETMSGMERDGRGTVVRLERHEVDGSLLLRKLKVT